MTTATREVLFEAQGTQPNFSYDVIQPLLHGRVAIEGAALRTTGATDVAGMWDNPKFQNGEFDLLDANWGDLVPCIDAGWDLRLLPVFIKRKPVYNYLWVRADRGIESPKDLEGKTDRKSTRLNSSHGYISYAVFCLKKKTKTQKK